METQSQSHQGTGITDPNQITEQNQQSQITQGNGNPPNVLQPSIITPTEHHDTPQPTALELQEATLEEAAFFENATGKTFNPEGIDEETQRILYQTNRMRRKWTPTVENAAATALQALYPDTGGSRVHGTL